MKKARKQLKKKATPLSANFFPASQELIQRAYNEAREVQLGKKFSSKLLKVKKLNAAKSKRFGEYLQKEILDLSKKFPLIEEMNPFYRDLLGAIVDVDKLKQNLSALNSSSKILKKIRSIYGAKFYSAKTIEESDRTLKEFEGRMISVVKKLEKPLIALKVESKKLKELPSIDFEAPTIVLGGYPNVGKSTLLKRITGSNAKISPYQFTTKQINVGHFEFKYRKIQFIDTPGLLDRPNLNGIEKKAVAALKHLASIIVFVVDPTQGCGFSVDEQLELLSKMRKEFEGKRILVVVNKIDIADERDIAKVLETEKNVVFDGENLNGKELKVALEKELALTRPR
ncbi:MAG TPA: GTPase [archaeon]|nr:GTPase [archaeon]